MGYLGICLAFWRGSSQLLRDTFPGSNHTPSTLTACANSIALICSFWNVPKESQGLCSFFFLISAPPPYGCRLVENFQEGPVA